MKTVWAKIFALIIFMMAAPAIAEEYIKSYHSVIDVMDDGKLTVTETITVNAEGDRINRGIFRDFPLYRTSDSGRRVQVDFEVLGVERNGSAEDWHTESISGGVRIYTGTSERQLRNGEHTYQITYQTGRQFFYADDYDDLTWNVTGNGWDFLIGEISATIVLPLGTKVEEVRYWTGALGATGSDARVSIEENEVYFASTRIFHRGEGMTIAVKLPKGVVSPLSRDDEMTWWLRDNASALISVLGGIGMFFYYYFSWSKVGRDPPRGVIVPRWDAPEGLSPALINYIENRGFKGEGWDAFSAAALNLAVHGYLVLNDLDKTIIFQRTEMPVTGKLHAGEKALLKEVELAGGTLTIDKANGEVVKSVGNKFRDAIEREHRGKYYQHNSKYVSFGIIASGILVVLAILLETSEDDITILIGLIFMVVAGHFIVRTALGLGRRLVKSDSIFKKGMLVIILGMVMMFGLSLLSTTVLVGAEVFNTIEDTPTFIGIGIIIIANLTFMALMGAPTPIGQKLSEGVEGLKIYLTLAEKDRMNMQGAPTMSPQHYETLLPYAVALGLEKNWTKAFDAWLATATATAASYAPTWYGDNAFGGFSDRIGGFASDLASNIQSTLPAPPPSSSGSFSSGGGGFSGSGGGGGGGGGW